MTSFIDDGDREKSFRTKEKLKDFPIEQSVSNNKLYKMIKNFQILYKLDVSLLNAPLGLLQEEERHYFSCGGIRAVHMSYVLAIHLKYTNINTLNNLLLESVDIKDR
jgi:uncharacterized protein YunC (DUF1805 family)